MYPTCYAEKGKVRRSGGNAQDTQQSEIISGVLDNGLGVDSWVGIFRMGGLYPDVTFS